MISWGILGTGYAAGWFADGLKSVRGARLMAVGSRRQSSARQFAGLLAVPRAYASYSELIRDKDIDVVYIATPNSSHRDLSLYCLNAGKAVLCEKPFTLNHAQAREVVDLARRKHLFCMEAMWTRFLPVMRDVRKLIDNRDIGDVQLLIAGIGHAVHADAQSRFFNRALGGGALLDLGVYGISLACHLLGEPSRVTGRAILGPTGVDEQCSVILEYAKGQLAAITASLRTQGPNEAVVMGTNGRLRIHEPLICPYRISLEKLQGQTVQSPSAPRWRSIISRSAVLRRLWLALNAVGRVKTTVRSFRGNGYNYEAQEVVRCLESGKTESELMPLDGTIGVMKILDDARQQWGLSYPGEHCQMSPNVN